MFIEGLVGFWEGHAKKWFSRRRGVGGGESKKIREKWESREIF